MYTRKIDLYLSVLICILCAFTILESLIHLKLFSEEDFFPLLWFHVVLRCFGTSGNFIMSTSMEGIIYWVKKSSGMLCERWSLMLFCLLCFVFILDL
jgi:hypothetical protein